MMSNGRFLFTMLTSVVVGSLVLVSCIVFVVNYATFGASVAAIEQVRASATTARGDMAEVIAGQVTDTNALIMTNRYYNHRWWSGWCVPNGWDGIPLVELPKE